MNTATVPTRASWSCPDGRLVTKAGATRDEWLAARVSGVGASEVASLLAIDGAYDTPYGVWLEKIGEPTDDGMNDELLRMGADIEAVVVARWTEQTGISTRRQGLMASRIDKRVLATVDRLTVDGGVLEAKVHTQFAGAVKEWRAGVIPEKFQWQAQQQLAVTGRSHAYVAAYVPGTGFWWHRIERDEAMIARIFATIKDFWRYVETQEAPPVALGVIGEGELKARYPSVVNVGRQNEADLVEAAVWAYQRLTEIKTAEKDLKAERARIENDIKAQIGDSEYLAADGVPLFRWKSGESHRFQEAKFKEENPELAEKYSPAQPTRTFSQVKQNKKEQAAA